MWSALECAEPGEPLDKERSRICRKACDYIRLHLLSQGRPLSVCDTPVTLVLDTNVVLDWLVFRDALPDALQYVDRQCRQG